MAWNKNCPKLVEDFIHTQAISRGLDERTAIAYRLDLEKFYLWPEASRVPEGADVVPQRADMLPEEAAWEDMIEDRMDAYLEYLSKEQGLRCSTISRKQKVFGYYLSYLASRGIRNKTPPVEAGGAFQGSCPGHASDKEGGGSLLPGH